MSDREWADVKDVTKKVDTVLVRPKEVQLDLEVVESTSNDEAGNWGMKIDGNQDRRNRFQVLCRSKEDPKRWREECKSVNCWNGLAKRLQSEQVELVPSVVLIVQTKRGLVCECGMILVQKIVDEQSQSVI